MDEARATKAATINGKLLSGPAEYTVDQMIFEINQYHQACSFEHGLQRLLDAAVDANGARATLRSLSSAATLRALEDRKAQLIADLQNAAITEKEGILADLKQVNAKMTEIVLSEAEIRAERPSAVVPAPATTSTGK